MCWAKETVPAAPPVTRLHGCESWLNPDPHRRGTATAPKGPFHQEIFDKLADTNSRLDGSIFFLSFFSFLPFLLSLLLFNFSFSSSYKVLLCWPI
jgi:hypothetical protein